MAETTPDRPVVLITEPIGAPGLRILEQACTCIAPWREGIEDQAVLRAELRRADAVVVRLFEVGAGDLARAPRLKVVAKHGAGLDNIDRAAATERGIPVIYTPGANANAVAEHAIALMLALARRTSIADATLRDGPPYERGKFQGIELAGKTLAIIGLGRIGSQVARKAHGLSMRVIAYDPYVEAEQNDTPAILFDSFDRLLADADFVTLHVPLTDETRNMIDHAALARLGPECRLINTSRGSVIDERALHDALCEGNLAGAALDVFTHEPLAADHPLLQAPNTLLTPHVSGITDEAMNTASRQIATGVIDVLEGRIPDGLVNPEVVGQPADFPA
ncbi:MAG: hydroxyacid dehydrogenase [Spirochaetaceae bacterium]|nr:hydroxyacid dehydrogenase [Spirochaetaceae bacterium]